MSRSDTKPSKVLVVFGTRPETIKLAPVIHELRRHRTRFNTVVVATGQHCEMLAQVVDVFQLRPDYSLRIMASGQSLTDVTCRVLMSVTDILRQECPDIVLVQGDTTTAFAAALAAFYCQIRVGHVEAGLRTYQKYSPYPEEINRRLVTQVTDWHFAPTETARANLLKEGVSDQSIVVTGNTVVDALVYIRSYLAQNPALVPSFLSDLPPEQRVIVVTAHRRESFGRKLQQMFEAVRTLARARPDILVMCPVHLNPNVQAAARNIMAGVSNIRLLAPLDYVSFVALMERSYILLTDSGGIQEEGPSLRKPVLVMRPVSERPEAIAAGTAMLVGTDPEQVLSAVNRLLDEPDTYDQMMRRTSPYGDGTAAARIVAFLCRTMPGAATEPDFDTLNQFSAVDTRS